MANPALGIPLGCGPTWPEVPLSSIMQPGSAQLPGVLVQAEMGLS